MEGRGLALADAELTVVGNETSAGPSVGDEVEVAVRSVASGGAGVGELPDGRVVFVHRTAPGDRSRVRITALKRSWGRARLVDVISPGPGRREAPCPHYDRCGGCTLEHLDYETQLEWKGRLVADALERIGHLGPVVPPPVVASPREFHYRSRVSFHLRRLRGDRVVAGFHELDDPGRLVDIGGDCMLPEPAVGNAWAALRQAWGAGAHRLPEGRTLRLTLRSVADGVLLLVEPEEGRGGSGEEAGGGGSAPEGGGAGELVERVESLRAVWWRESTEVAPVLLAGTADIEESWWNRRFRVGPTAFLQVNREIAERLHDAVMEELGDEEVSGRHFVDGYCGVGAYGRRLAERGATATGIELDAAAVETARRDAPDGFTVLEGRVEERLEDALPADAAVLNPPRTGLHESLPALLRDAGPARVVYVSCDPPTLARDLGRLEEAYQVARLQAFDLFPQTAHVEVVVTLERTGDPA